MKKIILVGAGGHALSCIDVIEAEKKYKIIGLIDNKKNSKKFTYKILGNDNYLKKVFKPSLYAFITLGQIKNFSLRKKLFKLISKLNFKIPVIISPYSVVSTNAEIQKGSIIMHKSIINSGSLIGKNCIINTGAIIEHNVQIGNNCHISTGVILNGDVRVGDNTFIGSGTVIKNSLSIGSNCIIGMNKTVKKNIKNNQIVK